MNELESDNSRMLAALARRLEGNPEFMAYALARYQSRQGISREDLSWELGLTSEGLIKLALCRRPDANSGDFERRVKHLSEYTRGNSNTLARVIKSAHDRRDPYKTGLLNWAGGFKRPALAAASGLVAALLFLCIYLLRDHTELRDLDSARESQEVVTRNYSRNDSGTINSSGGQANVPGSTAEGRPEARLPAPERPRAIAAKAPVSIDLRDYIVLRGGMEAPSGAGVIRLPSSGSRFVFVLPEGCLAGPYTVTVVDAFGNPLMSARGRSKDGRRLKVAFDVSRLSRTRLYLCITRENEASNCYPLQIAVSNRG
jgi:hypothetical protein